MESISAPPRTPITDPQAMLAIALEQARIGANEGGVPVGGAIFTLDGQLLGAGRNRLVQQGNCSLHGETDAFRASGRRATWHDTILVTTLAPCFYCSGLISQFRFAKVIVGDSVNAQGGLEWLKSQGIAILDLHSQDCINLIAKFQQDHPDLWKRMHRRTLSHFRLAILFNKAAAPAPQIDIRPEQSNTHVG